MALVNAPGDTAVHTGSEAIGLCGAAEGEGCAALGNRMVDPGAAGAMVAAFVRARASLATG